MALKTVNVMPIDSTLKTGPTRMLSGPVRMRTVTLDTAYGEFATWLYVGSSGDVSLVQWDGTTIVLPAMAEGVWHPVYSIMINSSGTSATGLCWAS